MANKPLNAARFPRCPDCGGEVRLLAKKGRTREYLRGVHLPVPDDFEIPTCVECGEESMVPEVGVHLDEVMKNALALEMHRCVRLLRSRYDATNQVIEDALGITRSYLSHLLAGRNPSPTLVKFLQSFVEVPGAFDFALRRPAEHNGSRETKWLEACQLLASPSPSPGASYRGPRRFGEDARRPASRRASGRYVSRYTLPSVPPAPDSQLKGAA